MLPRLRIVALLLVSSIPLMAQRAGTDASVVSKTLANGLEVIVIPNAAIPFATIELVVRAGAFAQEKPADAGLHHLIEHLLFRSGDAGSFNEAAAQLDASYNGITGVESVRYFLTLPARNFAKGLDLMSRTSRKPDFSKDAIDAERKVVQGELERHASEPNSLLYTEADALLWEGSWDRKNPGGNLFSLNAATKQGLDAIYRKFYVPNNAAVIIAGDVSDSVAFALVERSFGDWKRGPDPMATTPPPVIPPLSGIKRKIVTADVNDVTFLVRWHGPSVKADVAATYAADVFSGLVNQRVSNTQKRLVDSGLFTDLSMNYETLNFVGPISIVARTSPERAAAAADALGEELSKLVAPDYFNDEDLELAKKYADVMARFQLESGEVSAHMLADFWSSAGLAYFSDYNQRLHAETADDVRKYARTYIAGKPMAVNVLVSQETWSKVGVDLQRALGRWRTP